MNKKGVKTETSKQLFLQAMLKTFGNVTSACKIVGISRGTPYNWCKDDLEFKKEFESDIFEETFLDAIDSKLNKLALIDENPTVLIFLAKTKGKKRGYIERNETEVKIDTAIKFTLNID